MLSKKIKHAKKTTEFSPYECDYGLKTFLKIQIIVVINQFYDNDSSLCVRFYSQISSEILSSLMGQSKRKEKAITHFI